MIILFIAFVIVFNLLAASKFVSIAQMKGYNEQSDFSEYFWWCLLLGPAGWAMVIALPDRKAQFPERSASAKATIKDGAPTVSDPATDNDLPDL